MGANVEIVFNDAAMGEAFLRSPGTRSLVASEARKIAARAGHGSVAHAPRASATRPMASVWTRATTPEHLKAALRALEGAVI